jgi:hypothetical protein
MTDLIGRPTSIGTDITNDAAQQIVDGAPYTAHIRVVGTSALLFHRWSNEEVAEKASAAKGSKAKKEDNVESYVWRDGHGNICLPGNYLLGSLIDPRNGAAKYRQDPRSPRKSALDLFKAGVVATTDLAPIHSAATPDVPAAVWDYLDSRRVTVQRAGITRTRPAFLAGWSATVSLTVLTPEYIAPTMLLDVLTMGGRLVGVGDFRPTYGRFAITSFDLGFES